MSRFKRIVVLTGAGISAESGISTFRDKDGIWAKVDYREVATPEGFRRNPQRVLDFYNARRKMSGGAKPKPKSSGRAELATAAAAATKGSEPSVPVACSSTGPSAKPPASTLA